MLPTLNLKCKNKAEAGGFEPPVRLPVRQFSKLVVSATHPNFQSLRFLADSNRRTRFCRPLTKPLIQGTKNACKGCFPIAVAKVQLFSEPASILRKKFDKTAIFFHLSTCPMKDIRHIRILHKEIGFDLSA